MTANLWQQSRRVAPRSDCQIASRCVVGSGSLVPGGHRLVSSNIVRSREMWVVVQPISYTGVGLGERTFHGGENWVSPPLPLIFGF